MFTASPDRLSAAALAGLAELKRAIAPLQGELALTPLASGWTPVDELLGGGLPRGRLTEIAGARSCGKTSLALATAARVTQSAQLVAWVDGAGELYPPAAAASGVDLERLLLVRPPGDGMALARAGEIVARSRAFGLVVLDLAEGVFPERAAARLRAAAHESGVAVVALCPRRGALPHAHCQLEAAAAPAQPGDGTGLRRFAITLTRGGHSPGARVLVAHGAPAFADFRDTRVAAELRAAAEAIRPLRWTRNDDGERKTSP